MINRKYFFKGLKSLINSRSPAIALACSFVALGALMHNAGFNIQQSTASSFFSFPPNLLKSQIISRLDKNELFSSLSVSIIDMFQIP